MPLVGLAQCPASAVRCPGNRAHYDADNLEAARKLLLKALHLSPTQHFLRFNIAATMQVPRRRIAPFTHLRPRASLRARKRRVAAAHEAAARHGAELGRCPGASVPREALPGLVHSLRRGHTKCL